MSEQPMRDAVAAESQAEADHVELTVQRMAELHADFYHRATPLQRAVAGVTSALGRPLAVLVALTVALAWIAGNTLASRLGRAAVDPWPFPLLELAATVSAFLMTLFILATQRREDEAARQRAQLTLQLAAISEQKIAKVISLLEEQRRESPFLETRADPEADDMASAADPRHVLDRIIDTHSQAEK